MSERRMKEGIRRFDRRFLDGRARRWWLRNAVLGGVWGEFLDDLVAVEPGTVVLDLGAGEADLRARVRHARYVAVDRGIGHAGWDYSALDVVADALAVPLADGSAGLVISKQVLEHIPEPVAMLREVARVLQPGGRLLLSTNQSWPQHQKPHDYFRYTSFGLRYCCDAAGLAVERMEPMGGAFTAVLFAFSQTLPPGLWARSALGRRIAGVLLRPFGWLLRALTPLASALDRRDADKDNTLGWYVVARRPTPGV